MTENIVIGDVRPRIQLLGDGVQTEFIYPFAIFKETDLEVYLDDILQNANYTVLGAGVTDGGSVIFGTAPGIDVVVTLRRRLVIERLSDFAEGGAFAASVINQELDYLVAVAQQNAEDLQRCVILHATDGEATLVLPSRVDRADRTLAFDGDGVPIAGPGVSEILNAADSAETATQAAIDAVAAKEAAEDAAEQALTFDPALYRSSSEQITTADLEDGAVTQAKIDPAVTLGGPSLGANSIIRTNSDTITENLTIPVGTNGMSAGPITIANGFNIVVNGNWSIV